MNRGLAWTGGGRNGAGHHHGNVITVYYKHRTASALILVVLDGRQTDVLHAHLAAGIESQNDPFVCCVAAGEHQEPAGNR